MNFLYALIFIAGSGGNAATTSFERGFYTEASCMKAMAKIKSNVRYIQYIDCEKL